jgi:alkylhydroperoxidase family enzyme
MTFLPIADYSSLGPEAKAAIDGHIEAHGGGITNMRATLLSHVPSFRAYMEWYTLRDALVPFVGERAVNLFAYAISDENDCLVCAAYFRRILLDNGEDPDRPHVTETEQLLIDWGRLIVSDPRGISLEFYAKLEAAFNPQLRFLLVAFAGQMVATNLVNTVGKIPLDPELYDYRKPGDLRTS